MERHLRNLTLEISLTDRSVVYQPQVGQMNWNIDLDLILLEQSEARLATFSFHYLFKTEKDKEKFWESLIKLRSKFNFLRFINLPYNIPKKENSQGG